MKHTTMLKENETLRDDLARVTAERQSLRYELDEWQKSAVRVQKERNALRARVAELEALLAEHISERELPAQSADNPEEEPMSWREKAEQLVRERKARTFSEACSMLAKRRVRKQQPQLAVPAGYRAPYKDE